MATQPAIPAATWGALPSAPVRTPEQQKKTLDVANVAGNVQETTLGMPYVVPKKKADVVDAQLKSLRDLQQNARDELKVFDGLEEVRVYNQGMRYFATALNVPTGRIGDQELVTLAAKVQDPIGSVMQGDVNRYNDVQVALQRIPQAFKDEFTNTGRFTPETRAAIIRMLRNRVDTYREPYAAIRSSFEKRIGDFNAQVAPLGLRPIEAKNILSADPMTLYARKIGAYDKAQAVQDVVRQRESDRSGLPPEGAQIAGQDVQGFRFSPEGEADILAAHRDPKGTPEGAAAVMAERAVAEGLVKPEQREAYYQRALAGSRDFFKHPASQRAQGGVGYEQIDRAASENAGLGASVAQALRNTPESAVQLGEGLVALPKDAIISVLTGERSGSIRTFTDLAAELAQGQLDGPATQAFAQVLEDRYGSLDAIKRTAITDPLGLTGDVSMLLTAGGSAAARLPGVGGRVGAGVATAGRAIDPLSGIIGLATEAAPAAYRGVRARVPDAVTGVENLPSEVLAFPSGVGGDALREAVGAGLERGRAGAPTPRSEALTEGMRRPETAGERLIATAREAVANLRQQASARYQTAMQQFGRAPAPLDISVVQQRLARIRPRNYDAMLSAPRRPSEHVAWEQMNDTVTHYAQEAASNPALLEPLAMDQFKQDLYDIGSKIGGAYDRDASRIARTAYNAVRQELVKHDPIYADTMRDYERVAQEATQLETTFGLAAARGKQPNVESATRRLQAAIGRNNANVAYGQRAGQVRRLNELDPEGTIVPTLAGATLSSWRPRGLNAAVGLGAGSTAAVTNPLALLAAPVFMPRVIGEAAYGAGRAAGTGLRLLDAGAASPFGRGFGAAATGTAALFQKYPLAFLASAQAGSRAQETEVERLGREYGLQAPAAPDDRYGDFRIRP